MSEEQVWDQLELRTKSISSVVGELVGEEVGSENEGGDDDSDESTDEIGSDEGMTEEEFNRMLVDSEDSGDSSEGREGIEGIEGDEGSEGSETSESDQSEGSMDENEFQLLDDLNDKRIAESVDNDEDDDLDRGHGKDEEDEGPDNADEEDGLVQDETRGRRPRLLGSDEEDLAGTPTSDDELRERIEDGSPNGFEVDNRKAYTDVGSARRKRHPVLDDEFFSIDDFNRLTEESEAKRLTTGRLGGSEDDEEELEDTGTMLLQNGDEQESKLIGSVQPSLMLTQP